MISTVGALGKSPYRNRLPDKPSVLGYYNGIERSITRQCSILSAMTEGPNPMGPLRHQDSQNYFIYFAKKARILSGYRPK